MGMRALGWEWTKSPVARQRGTRLSLFRAGCPLDRPLRLTDARRGRCGRADEDGVFYLEAAPRKPRVAEIRRTAVHGPVRAVV